jgi:hypothetical protein
MLSNNTKRNLFGFLSEWLAAPLLKGLAGSQSFDVANVNDMLDKSGDSNFILAFWHGHMLPTLFYFARSQYDQSSFYTFISPHRDGEYITRAASGLGINALRTSLRDRRISAFKKVFKIVDDNQNLAITPDGPIGPCFEAKSGIIKLSRRFELPVIPLAALPRRGKYFDSWDRLVLPYPFSTVFVRFGNTLRFDEGRSLDEASRVLQTELNSLTRTVAEKVTLPQGYRELLP